MCSYSAAVDSGLLLLLLLESDARPGGNAAV
jgi:hypothetical protein